MTRYLSFLLVLYTAISFSQHKPEWEKIKTLKIAYLTEQLDLTSQEAQKFWPLYNAFDKKREALRQKERQQIRGKMKTLEQLSETDAEAVLEQFNQIKLEQNQMHKAFLYDLKKVLSAKKTLLLLRAEEDFKRRLMKQYRNSKGRK